MEDIKDTQLRREAKKQGYILRKSRGSYSGDNLCGYMIVNANTGRIEAGANFNMSAEDVEKFLSE